MLPRLSKLILSISCTAVLVAGMPVHAEETPSATEQSRAQDCQPAISKTEPQPGEPPYSEFNANEKSYKIFFASDRSIDETTVSSQFSTQVTSPIDYISYGELNVVPPEPSQWFVISPKQLGLHNVSSADDLVETMRSSGVGERTSGSIIIFIHGCCTSFPVAAIQAALLARFTGATVVMYDWGSPFGDYASSGLAFPRSQERFNSFMLTLTHAFPKERMAAVAFSMGNNLLEDFLLQYRNEDIGRRFDQLVFSRADVDSLAFKSHLSRVKAHARKTFIYSADNDTPINMSHWLRFLASPSAHGERLGEIRSGVGITPAEDLFVVDLSPLKLNHSIPYAVIGEFFRTDDGLPASQTYDYSRNDDGILQVHKHSH